MQVSGLVTPGGRHRGPAARPGTAGSQMAPVTVAWTADARQPGTGE
jgi:hypothetical protein